ncbi:MAG: hypothetical protein QOF59_1379 [Actinomycetota bacterium]|nr:hypothetical protein [Actinomycetota bacterium]
MRRGSDRAEPTSRAQSQSDRRVQRRCTLPDPAARRRIVVELARRGDCIDSLAVGSSRPLRDAQRPAHTGTLQAEEEPQEAVAQETAKVADARRPRWPYLDICLDDVGGADVDIGADDERDACPTGRFRSGPPRRASSAAGPSAQREPGRHPAPNVHDDDPAHHLHPSLPARPCRRPVHDRAQEARPERPAQALVVDRFLGEAKAHPARR